MANVADVMKVKDDPTFTKFFKMLKMHIPKPAVAMKMTAEGLDPAVLDLDPDAPSPSASGAGGAAAAGAGPAAALKTSASLQAQKDIVEDLKLVGIPKHSAGSAPKSKLKQIYWQTIPPKEVTCVYSPATYPARVCVCV